MAPPSCAGQLTSKPQCSLQYSATKYARDTRRWYAVHKRAIAKPSNELLEDVSVGVPGRGACTYHFGGAMFVIEKSD